VAIRNAGARSADHLGQCFLADIWTDQGGRRENSTFRKLGFISYNGKIEVNSSLLNAVLYDKPEIKSEL